jgi:xyloglucan-specific exo-beta-1,4-glucanase
MSHEMRHVHPLTSFLHSSVLLALAIGLLSPAAFGQANAAGYTWSNVYTGGGGGYIPNIIFNPSQQNLIYARTDIGGAYKWNSTTNLWVPLMDWVTWANWNELGVESIATDPVNPNNLYIMAGLYTNSFTTQNGTLLISNNQGSTFTQVPMPFKVGGNMPARNMGERLAIDPNLNSTLFFAARSGNGLWESTNSGTTWSQVNSFPTPGTYAVEPGNVYSGDIIGPAWVVFDPRTGSAGKATQTIYVGVAQPDGTNIYVTKNGGTTWAAVPGQPTCTLTGTQTTGTVACTNGATWSVASDAPGPGFFPDRAVLAPTTGMLYVTYSNGAGPYDGTMGDVQQYNTATGAWTEIAPVVPTTASGADYFGYCGLAVDPEVPTTIMVSAFNSWWPDTILWRSTNSGATWSQIWNWTSYPSRSLMYTLNDTAAPWVNEGDTNPVAPIMAPELGWMVSGLAIDPFNSNHMLYGTGMTMWGTNNLTEWDAGNQFALSIASQGIEETSVLDLISPPAGGGAHLFSAMGDIGGFIHTSMTTAPAFPYAIPFFGTRTSIDYAELSPQFMVLVGDGSPTASPVITSSAFTYSGGTSETAWFAGSVDPPGYSTNGGGTVAAAADASRVVWNPTGMEAFYSTTNGSSWTASTGLPAGGIIASDRVNPLQFYDYAGGQFYVSTNGGVSFSATAATGLPASGDSVNFKAVPGHTGDIWLAGGSTTAGDVYGLWHSTNGGASFTQLANVQQADVIGFGMAAPGASYPTLFTNAEIGGVRGIFASTNEGATWTQINDVNHEYAMANSTITGDPQVFGTVYLGTNGRGIIMGTGTPPSSSSSGSFTLKPSASSLSVTQGSSGTDTITVTDVSPFSGSVTLAASGLPSGVTATFGTNPTTGTSVLTLAASSSATTGPATVTITGTSGTLTAVTSIALTVVVPPTGSFTLKPSAATLSVIQGSSATDTITVTDVSPFTGSITLAASGLPSGVTAAFGTNPTTGTSVLTLTASSTATTGAATVTITGNSGTLTATTSIALTVNPAASFALAPSTATLSVTRGSSATDTITVTDVGGFTGSVTLAASGLPSGVTAAFGTNPTTGSSVLTLTASSTTITGAATVTITGTSGTVTATTTITLTVNPAASFTLAPSASTLSVTQSSSATDTITVTDVGGFTGSVTLAASGLPSGVTAAFGTNPTTGASVLTLTASSTATTGAATVTVTGTSGSLTATTTVALTVNPSAGGAKCTIDYTISSQWSGGFGAAIAINNTGTTALTNWTLTWAFANGQTVTQLWNGTETQSGANVTVTNMSYNGGIPAGGSYTGMGFNGSWNNVTNAIPTTFSLNGTACTVN